MCIGVIIESLCVGAIALSAFVVWLVTSDSLIYKV
jgi:hypothetical protein